MAAITSAQFVRKIRALFGEAEDSTGAVADRARRCAMQVLHFSNADSNTSATDPIAAVAIGTVQGGGTVTSVKYVARSSATVSATDNFTLIVARKASSTWSATVAIGSIAATTDAWVTNGAGKPVTFTLATAAGVSVAKGDVLFFSATKGGTGCLVPNGELEVVVE